MSLTWKSAFQTGLPEIDGQHMELLQRINTFVEAVDEGRDREYLKGFLDFLSAYVVEHFATEERLMSSSKYPNIKAHLSDHKALTTAIIRFRNDLVITGSWNRDLAVEVKKILTDWFNNHVGDEDQLMGRHVMEKDG